jgi:histidine phosphotransferase ChpT
MEPVTWPKDWAKLLMNTVLVAGDCLPRGGTINVERPPGAAPQRFSISGKGVLVRLTPETERALAGETVALDGRSVQPYLTSRLARNLGAKFSTLTTAAEIRFVVE